MKEDWAKQEEGKGHGKEKQKLRTECSELAILSSLPHIYKYISYRDVGWCIHKNVYTSGLKSI